MKLNNNYIRIRIRDICSLHQTLHLQFVQTVSLGPELYFHLRCLACLKAMKNGVITQTHGELLYGVLTAWGMNSRKARLEPFEIFWQSLKSARNLISELQHVTPRNARKSDWDKLHILWISLRVTNSASEYQLVGKSKLLAHLLPNWIAPIDRAHTLKFLTRSKSMSAKEDIQWKLFRGIHEKFFAYVARQCAKSLALWVQSASAYGWDSSVPKTIDNLIWAKLQQRQAKKKRK